MIRLPNSNAVTSFSYPNVGLTHSNNLYNWTTSRYGTWDSEITSSSVTFGTVTLDGVRVCVSNELSVKAYRRLYFCKPRTGHIFLAEGRPNGNVTIIQILDDGSSKDVLPTDYNVKTNVHEYGGGAWEILSTGEIIITNLTVRMSWWALSRDYNNFCVD